MTIELIVPSTYPSGECCGRCPFRDSGGLARIDSCNMGFGVNKKDENGLLEYMMPGENCPGPGKYVLLKEAEHKRLEKAELVLEAYFGYFISETGAYCCFDSIEWAKKKEEAMKKLEEWNNG